jgi:uncharacterized membrane protein
MSRREFSRTLLEVVVLGFMLIFLGGLALATLQKTGTIDPEIKGWIGGLLAGLSMRGMSAAWDSSRNKGNDHGS